MKLYVTARFILEDSPTACEDVLRDFNNYLVDEVFAEKVHIQISEDSEEGPTYAGSY